MRNSRSRFAESVRSSWFHVAVAIAVFLGWEALCRLLHLPEYLVPAPSNLAARLWSDAGYLLGHVATTFAEAVLGLALAAAVGFSFGVLFAHSRVAERAILPYFVAYQAVPIIAVAPLFILWFGNGLGSKVAMAGVLCFFPITVSTSRGLASVSSDQLDLFRIHAATRWQIFAHLRLPTSVPYLMTGIRVSTSLAMIGAIVAEYAGADRGIGYVIMQSSYRLDTPLLFCAIGFAALGGVLLYGAVRTVESVFLDRFTKND
jgi:NitT/TauT family transport system permease protein